MFKWLVGKVKEEILGEIQPRIKREAERVRKEEVLDSCKEVLEALLNEKSDNTEVFRWFGTVNVKNLRKEIKDSVLEFCVEELKKNEKERIGKFIAGEEFIDSIVDRINRKQLDGRCR